MAKFRYSHLFTKKSGSAAIEAAATELNQAEIALAIAKDNEKILFKNVSGDVVTVPTDAQVDAKIASQGGDTVSGVTPAFDQATGKLNVKVLTDKGDFSGETTIGVLTDFFDDVEYDSSAKTITFYNGQTQKAVIDTSDFVIDGMIDSVSIQDVESGATTVKCLVIVWNTDAGKETVNIPLTEIFNPDNYYTKSEIDDITSGINEDIEAVSGDVVAISGEIETIGDGIEAISGDVETISGDVETISDDVATISGDVETLESAVQTLDEEKQDALTAGQCIVIDTNNVIYFDANKDSDSGVTITLTAGEFE